MAYSTPNIRSMKCTCKKENKGKKASAKIFCKKCVALKGKFYLEAFCRYMLSYKNFV